MAVVQKNPMELTKEQQAFLEECSLEFSERYTDADLEYKKIYDLGIPPPPIVYPWWGPRGRKYNRDRPGGSRYSDGYRNNDYRDMNRRPGPYSYGGASMGRDDRRYDTQRHRDRDYSQRDNATHQNHYRQHHYRPY